jgi:RNA polymerase sigma-70 factor (ECF subfamily)
LRPIDPFFAGRLSIWIEMPGAALAIMTPAPPTEPDSPHLAAAQAGDRAALEALLAELLPRMRNLVRYLIRGDHEVDDIVQDALLAVVRGLAGFRGDGRLQSWVDRITARTTFAHLRRTRGRDARADAYAEPEELGVAEPLDEQYAARRRAVRLLDQLPDEQRHALVLHHVLGMTVGEIADQLATPVETVRSRMRLGRNRLREAERRHAQRRTPTNSGAEDGGARR